MGLADPVIFVVDDDADIRSSLSRALGKRGFEVVCFASALAFAEAYDPEQAGCILLDQGMPGMTGLELQAHLARKGYTIPIIFITGHGGVPESVQAIKAGAIDFLEKPFSPDVLVHSIRAALDADAKGRADHHRQAQARLRLDTLTPREREIADFIFANPSTTSSKEIARALDISPRTVDHHRARILEKMVLKSIAELITVMSAAQAVRS
ncbi:MAG: response regulator [Pseudomonadota bacterium]